MVERPAVAHRARTDVALVPRMTVRQQNPEGWRFKSARGDIFLVTTFLCNSLFVPFMRYSHQPRREPRPQIYVYSFARKDKLLVENSDIEALNAVESISRVLVGYGHPENLPKIIIARETPLPDEQRKELSDRFDIEDDPPEKHVLRGLA